MHTSTRTLKRHSGCYFGFTLGALLMITGQGKADEPLRLVEESCDEIAIVHVPSKPSFGPEVVFVRNSRILDRRFYSESMVMTVEGDTFTLVWTDWQCVRSISAKKLSIYEIEPLEVANSGPWWVAPFRQLKQP
jgi:hypothetical protein